MRKINQKDIDTILEKHPSLLFIDNEVLKYSRLIDDHTEHICFEEIDFHSVLCKIRNIEYIEINKCINDNKIEIIGEAPVNIYCDESDINKLEIYKGTDINEICIQNCTIDELFLINSIIETLEIVGSKIKCLHLLLSIINSGIYKSYNSEIEDINLQKSIVNNTNVILENMNMVKHYKETSTTAITDMLYEECIDDLYTKSLCLDNSLFIENNTAKKHGLNKKSGLNESFNTEKNVKEEGVFIAGIYNNIKGGDNK